MDAALTFFQLEEFEKNYSKRISCFYYSEVGIPRGISHRNRRTRISGLLFRFCIACNEHAEQRWYQHIVKDMCKHRTRSGKSHLAFCFFTVSNNYLDSLILIDC